MRFLGQFKNVAWLLTLCALFAFIGMIVGSNLSIPDKLRAQSDQSDEQGYFDSGYSLVTANGHSPFVAVAQKMKPAVVNISAESVTEDKFHNFMDDEFFKRFFGNPPENQKEPRTRRSESMGSGFIFSKDGYILTNNHVVKGAEKITVTLSDQHKFRAELIGTDAETDLAVLKIETDYDLPIIPLGNSDSILVGDWVMAIGNPFPQLGLDRTVTVGVVSAKGRKGLTFGGMGDVPSYQSYIQTDASINPGNSGGPLVGLNGQAIGVNSAIATPTGGNVGIGFAIPINLANKVIDQLINTGSVSRGYLGIYPQDISYELKEAQGLASSDGILVAQVDKNTPADKGGLKVGDVILTFNDAKIVDAQQFRFLVADAGPGAKTVMEIIRNGISKSLTVKLGNRSEILDLAQNQEDKKEENKAWLGLEVEVPDKELIERFGLDDVSGALVVSVEPGSPADDAGLSRGDIIQKIANNEIEDTDDFYKAAEKMADNKRPISFYIKRGNSNIFIAVTPE